MTTRQIHALAIELGIKHDLRGVARVQKNLARVKKQYGELSAKQKAEFDADKLTNPYSDTLV
jgi:hypothetical protein